MKSTTFLREKNIDVYLLWVEPLITPQEGLSCVKSWRLADRLYNLYNISLLQVKAVTLHASHN